MKISSVYTVNFMSWKISISYVYSFLLMQDYRHIIESLPEDDKPDYFGLPANIARSAQRMISSQVKLHFSLFSECFLHPV